MAAVIVPVPGAKSLTQAQLTSTMSVPVLGPIESAITTLAVLAPYLASLAPALPSGTVTANAATPVPVVNTNVKAASQILLTYKSGTQGATAAFVSSKTAASGFSITSVTGDTAVYDYLILT